MTLLRASDGNARLTLPTKACSVCSQQFIQRSSLHTICSPKCALTIPSQESKRQKAQAKAERQATKARKEAIKPRAKWLAEAQAEVNKWVRTVRDASYGCISCGTMTGKMNGGHYLSVGARPELRFEPLNISKQCERCNTYLHGNLIVYRINLIARIGLEKVEWLEGPHEPKKWSIEQLRLLIASYRVLNKAAS